MSTTKACLFGGTLLAAGLTAADASAQSFNHEQTLAGAYAYDYSSYAFDFVGTGGFVTDSALSGSIAQPGGAAASWGWDSTAGTWSASMNQGNTSSYAYSSMASFFSVSSAYSLEVNWDISNINDLGGWQLFESDDLSFTPDEILDGISTVTTYGTPAEAIGPIGILSIQLDPTKFYQLAFDLFASNGSATIGSGNISAAIIPSPAPMLLLGMSGMACCLRRRRA